MGNTFKVPKTQGGFITVNVAQKVNVKRDFHQTFCLKRAMISGMSAGTFILIRTMRDK